MIIKFHLILLMLTPAYSGWDRPQKPTVCQTPACQKRGLLYFQNLNPSVKPCDSFYDFACGRWVKNNPVPKYKTEWNVAHTLVKKALFTYRSTALILVVSQLLELLVEGNFRRDARNYVEAKIVFDTCSKIPTIPLLGPKGIVTYLSKVGRYPDTPLWEIHNKFLSLTGESAFFDFLVSSNKPDEIIPSVIFFEPVSAYGAIVHNRRWQPAEEKAYMDFLFLGIKSLKLKDEDAVIKKRIMNVFEFRKAFNSIIYRTTPEAPDGFNPVTIQKMHSNFRKSNLKNSQKIPWESMGRIILQSLPRQVVETRNILDVRYKEFFDELINLLGRVSEETLAYHMEIHFIERHLIYTDAMNKLLTTLSTSPDNQHIRPQTYERWESCIQNYPDQRTLGQLYIEKEYPMTNNRIIHDIINRLKISMKIQMDKSYWLKGPPRGEINRKLDTLIEWIGFPPWYRNSAMEQPADDQSDDILTPNASFNIEQNRLYLHATLLTSPVFDGELPSMYNIAGVGAVVGHELYHLIAECGTHEYEKNGKLVKLTWWPAPVQQQCFNRAQCFINQYRELTQKDLKQRYGSKKLVKDTSASYSEDIADVMGIDAAFNAFKAAWKNDPRVCQTLPQFPELSCEQLFFLTYANKYCEVLTPTRAEHLIVTDSHSLSSVRVNGAMMNNEDFAKAFSCPVGSPMNPRRKCNLWK